MLTYRQYFRPSVAGSQKVLSCFTIRWNKLMQTQTLTGMMAHDDFVDLIWLASDSGPIHIMLAANQMSIPDH